MTYVLDRVEGAYPELPEPDHIEEVLQGTSDFIAGVEGFQGAYTQAQKYLWSCLESSDTISYKARVGGMEGMISDGFSAAWDYVAKIFKSLWDYFFGGGEDSGSDKAEKTEKQADNTEKKMAKLENGNLPDEQAKAVLRKGKAKAEKIQKNPKASSTAKSKAKTIEEKILATTSGKSKDKPAAVARDLTKELMAIDPDLPVKLNAKIQTIEATVHSWIVSLDKVKSGDINSSENRAVFDKTKAEIRASVLLLQINGFRTMNSLVYPDAKKLLGEIQKALKADRTMLTKFRDQKQAIDKQLAEVKKAAGNPKGKSSNKGVDDLKKIAGLLSKAATSQVTINNCYSAMIAALDEAIAAEVIVI